VVHMDDNIPLQGGSWIASENLAATKRSKQEGVSRLQMAQVKRRWAMLTTEGPHKSMNCCHPVPLGRMRPITQGDKRRRSPWLQLSVNLVPSSPILHTKSSTVLFLTEIIIRPTFALLQFCCRALRDKVYATSYNKIDRKVVLDGDLQSQILRGRDLSCRRTLDCSL
jgi:hypothetical protein